MTLLPAMNASGAVGHGWSQMNLYGGGDGGGDGSGDGGVCVCMLAHACVLAACLMCLQYTIIIFDLC